MNSKFYLPAGSTGAHPYTVSVTPESTGWAETSLWITELAAGESVDRRSGPDEILVVPLSGSLTVSSGDGEFTLTGRKSVFHGPTDFAYVGRDSGYRVASARGARVALCGARAGRRLPLRYGAAADVPVELRGAGDCSREVHNFATADVFEADSIIACEVITPGGNWSSYPAHKHDENTDAETQLEEIYYFEIADGPDGAPGFGYHRVYGTPRRPIEVLEEVRSGDVVLVPHGYHGPSIAAPGHHMYYLNVMAGSGPKRAWLVSFDPHQDWLRRSWEHQPVDPRLPLQVSGD
ncbi:5-deoxy-glucuronate isomerase [Mycobacterium sp.]|uniref:5-deoxy-glucuronate isomerase n=1 Tax=Mycobacterium sp. TaxID=1785 RepID=UPI002C54A4CA|nr:5-deoxy-glucuronate isomerase [Mycobacterium sp.]HME47619.1 5-deoxy-glucuronate isomerase [Mycobacterium sp.]